MSSFNQSATPQAWEADCGKGGNLPLIGGRKLRDVTPSDSVDLPNGIARALIVTAGTSLALIAADDTSPVTIPVVPGQWVNIHAKRVMASGTDATGIKAVY